MRELRLWDADDEPEVREAKANQAIDQLLSLKDSSGWDRLVEYIEDEVACRRDLLERSSKDDERHRGAIEALRFIQQWPERVWSMAQVELTNHRGN